MHFSIVTACLQADERLERTAQSIANQPGMSGDSEHIVVCSDTSGASDEILAKLAGKGVHVINENDNSLYDGLAKGMQAATGDIVSYLNAGDLYFPEALATMAEAFRLERVGWVTGYATLCNERGQKIAAWKPAPFDRELFKCGAYCSDLPRHPWVQQESTLWKRELMHGLDWDRFRSFRLAGDYYLWMHLSERADLYSLHALVGSFLCNPGQMSSNRQAYFNEIQPFFSQPSLRQRLKMWVDFRASWQLKVKADRLLRGRCPNRVIQFSPDLDRWCIVE